MCFCLFLLKLKPAMKACLWLVFFSNFFYLFALVFSETILLLHDIPWPSLKFHDPSRPGNWNNKFHDFPGFSWPETLLMVMIWPWFQCLAWFSRVQLHISNFVIKQPAGQPPSSWDSLQVTVLFAMLFSMCFLSTAVLNTGTVWHFRMNSYKVSWRSYGQSTFFWYRTTSTVKLTQPCPCTQQKWRFIYHLFYEQ